MGARFEVDEHIFYTASFLVAASTCAEASNWFNLFQAVVVEKEVKAKELVHHVRTTKSVAGAFKHSAHSFP